MGNGTEPDMTDEREPCYGEKGDPMYDGQVSQETLRNDPDYLVWLKEIEESRK